LVLTERLLSAKVDVLHYSTWDHPDHDARKDTKHHNVLTKCKLGARIAISFRIPLRTTYLIVGHVVNFKQYWQLLVGDIDYTVTELEGKKLTVSVEICCWRDWVERHAKTQMEFTHFYESRTFIREMCN